MHQFGWLLERGDNFLNLLKEEGGTQKGGVGFPQKRGIRTLEETMNIYTLFKKIYMYIIRFYYFLYIMYNLLPQK